MMVTSNANRSLGRYFKSLLLLLLGSSLLLLWGCQQASSDQLVVSQEVVVEGDTVVVTRVVQQVVQVPVTVTPDASEEEEAVLDMGLSGAPDTVDPQRASSDSEIQLVENLFVGLTRFNHAANTVEPDLATDWEVSDDGRTWTFHLRSDIFWVKSGLHPQSASLLPQDTEPQAYRPVVADDVVYAIQRACNPRTQTPDVVVLFVIEGCEEVHGMVEPTAEDLGRVGARAVDETTVEITLREPAAYFPTVTSLWLVRPVPVEVVSAFADTDQSWATMDKVLTSGRFVFGAETVQDTRTVLLRNPFWPDPFSGTVDLVNIFWLDTEAAFELWVDKGLDISPMPTSELETIMDDPSLRPRHNLIPNQSAFYLSFNHESEVFSEPAVRRAFSAAIDREALIEEVYGGRGLPMQHFSPPGVLGAPPREEVGIGYDPDWARRQMAESSFNDCKFIPKVRYLVSSSDLALHHAETLRDMWERELGCPEESIEIEQVQFGTLLANTRSDAGAARPDLWDLGWASYFPDAHNWLGDVLHCTQSENRQNRACSEADNLIEQAAVTRSAEERVSLYRQAEQAFFGEQGSHPVAPLFVQARHVLVHPWLVYDPAHFGGEQYDTYFLDPTTKRLEREQ